MNRSYILRYTTAAILCNSLSDSDKLVLFHFLKFIPQGDYYSLSHVKLLMTVPLQYDALSYFYKM
jgi:hypothetical protein